MAGRDWSDIMHRMASIAIAVPIAILLAAHVLVFLFPDWKAAYYETLLAVAFISSLIALPLFGFNMWLGNSGKKEIMDKFETMDKKLDSMDKKLDSMDKLDEMSETLREMRDTLQQMNRRHGFQPDTLERL